MSHLPQKLTTEQIVGGLLAGCLSPEIESLSHGIPRYTAAEHRHAEGIEA